MKIDNYKPKNYWERRLQTHPNLKGVGHLGFNETYNKYIYLLKTFTLERILDKYSIKIKDKSILDVGCGIGFFIDYYSKKCTKDIVGIDLANVSVSMLKERYPSRHFQVGDISNPNIRLKKTFDLINVFDVLYHITNDNKFENSIRNISRLCNKKGYVLITDIFWKNNLVTAKHVKFRSLKKYKEVLPKNNIEILGIFPVYYLLNRTFHLPVLLLNKLGPIFYFVDKNLQKTKMLNGKNIKLLIGRKK